MILVYFAVVLRIVFASTEGTHNLLPPECIVNSRTTYMWYNTCTIYSRLQYPRAAGHFVHRAEHTAATRSRVHLPAATRREHRPCASRPFRPSWCRTPPIFRARHSVSIDGSMTSLTLRSQRPPHCCDVPQWRCRRPTAACVRALLVSEDDGWLHVFTIYLIVGTCQRWRSSRRRVGAAATVPPSQGRPPPFCPAPPYPAPRPRRPRSSPLFSSPPPP